MACELPVTVDGWEVRLVGHFLAIGSDGDASDIRSLEVTPVSLTEACGVDAKEADFVEAAFQQQILAAGSLPHILRHGSPRPPSDALPNCFVYLAMTLLIDSHLDGDYETEGSFRDKLAIWLNTNCSFQQLTGIARMWRVLAAWLDRRIKAGMPYRHLILPDPPRTWTHIGYTRRLSFPSRTDARMLKRFVAAHPEALIDPQLLLSAFPRVLQDRQTSWGLREAFREFHDAYLLGCRTLADHRFWRLLQRSRPATVGDRTTVRVEMALTEDAEILYSVAIDHSEKTALYASCGEALSSTGVRQSENLGQSLRRGVVFFQQVGVGRWRAECELRGSHSGIYVAVRADLVSLIGDGLGRLDHDTNWAITSELQKVGRTEELLQRVGLVAASGGSICRATFVDGVRVGTAWLGRGRFLPRVDAEATTLEIRGDAADCALRAEGLQLVAESSVHGFYVIEPAHARRETRAPWRLRLQLACNALPQDIDQGSRRHLAPLHDWRSVETESRSRPLGESLDWEMGDVACEDVLEAAYADGTNGWEESDFVHLLQRAGSPCDVWTLLRCLHDAGVVVPRLRQGWRGRVWTLVPPRVAQLRGPADEPIVVVEGALCTQLVDDFRMVVEGAGGRCFKRLGMSSWSVPTFGATGTPVEVISERLRWPRTAERSVPTRAFGGFETTNRHAELHRRASTWSWQERRFVSRDVDDGPVQLTRRVHPAWRDHDVYRVESAGRLTHYLSRTAAIAAAHVAARTPLFRFCGGGLLRLAHDGGLPDAISTYLRQRRLRCAGPSGNGYAYPCSPEDAQHLAMLLPGCLEGVVSPRDNCDMVSIARRSSGQLRVQWRHGRLSLTGET